MEYLTEIKTDENGFRATMFNGRTTKNYEAASFFMDMQAKSQNLHQTRGHIRTGKMIDRSKPWKEIERLIA